jgi:drug/metabolite transporter (DMT)-like permease
MGLSMVKTVHGRNAAMMMALSAALLFGSSVPLAKLMLDSIDPLMLAALLYLGSGIGMAGLKLGQKAAGKAQSEASMKRADAPWLLGALLVGGVAAPVILLFALDSTPSSTAALLLNFEAVGTVLIAGLMFREAIGKRVWLALVLVIFGGIALTVTDGGWGMSIGAVGIIVACFLWGLDNNLTRNISAKDPVAIVALKGIGAGIFSLLLALLLGQSIPQLSSIAIAMLIGFVCYGLSLYLYVLALRGLGAARTGAFFAIAPFGGAMLGMAMFQDSLTIGFLVSLPLLVAGAVLLFSEAHGHSHTHKNLDHEHRHSHDDEHHAHAHDAEIMPGQAHSHNHEHEATEHAHPHAPDIHHRHEHETKD